MTFGTITASTSLRIIISNDVTQTLKIQINLALALEEPEHSLLWT